MFAIQEVVCGKCEKTVPLRLVRRFRSSDDTTLATIDQVLSLSGTVKHSLA